ncbi:MAG TPA: proline dehydrogenase family protein [Ignavibacteriaceae bacterium]|nr:proline dehydrogenase family protein [Ignavibacteriaceae bacterium]
MGISRNILLWASKNEWLKSRVPKMSFVQKAVKRFMPGEKVEDAIEATRELLRHNIPTTFTHLGENITNLDEAEINSQHYLDLLDRIHKEKLDVEISLKLTHIGLDLSFDKTLELFLKIADKAKQLSNNVFIDIEDSSYADKTINFYKKVKEKHNNVGLCLQAYLYRTIDDIKSLKDINPCIRLVKGAYKEPSTVAFPKISKVNENFLSLSKYLLGQMKDKGTRAAFGTHDLLIQEHVKNEAAKIGLPNNAVEFQMLYGIKTSEQIKLASEGYKIRTLISFGDHWYPWYVRRLAERPANVFLCIKKYF